MERNTPESRWSFAWLRYVQGEKVLSVGCGPNFYDDVQFFGNTPKEFVGIDINKNNISFLKRSTHPEILKWKKFLNDNHVRFELYNENVLHDQKNFKYRFDIIYLIGVLGMFDTKMSRQLFKNLNSYLKPVGVLIDIDWTDTRLSDEKLQERKSYTWYSTEGPGIKMMGTIIKNSGFNITHNEIHYVANPKDYGWGKIYVFIANKTREVS
ncbi:MAG: methyltransferase domain-containing protein [Ignavibacteriaceae bacterium]